VEFVEYFALLKEMPPSRVPRAVAEAVERVDLGAKAKSRLRALSGGLLRRVGVAQAIVNDPDLLWHARRTHHPGRDGRAGRRAA
jgi:ABC-2 type transport system ATP-binding protein